MYEIEVNVVVFKSCVYTSLMSGISPIFQMKFKTYLMIQARLSRWIVATNDIMHSCFINRGLVTIMFCARKFQFVDNIFGLFVLQYNILYI